MDVNEEPTTVHVLFQQTPDKKLEKVDVVFSESELRLRLVESVIFEIKDDGRIASRMTGTFFVKSYALSPIDGEGDLEEDEDDDSYTVVQVPSQDGRTPDKKYDLSYDEDSRVVYLCSCPAFVNHPDTACKHMTAFVAANKGFTISPGLARRR